MCKKTSLYYEPIINVLILVVRVHSYGTPQATSSFDAGLKFVKGMVCDHTRDNVLVLVLVFRRKTSSHAHVQSVE